MSPVVFITRQLATSVQEVFSKPVGLPPPSSLLGMLRSQFSSGGYQKTEREAAEMDFPLM